MDRQDTHLLGAVKLAMFAIVGLGWLAVREYLGALPVSDAAALLSLPARAGVNLVLALLLPTEAFTGPARAFFTEVLALCVLYGYSLAQSVGSIPLACSNKGDFSHRLRYAFCLHACRWGTIVISTSEHEAARLGSTTFSKCRNIH
jgi:hypothetical protein